MDTIYRYSYVSGKLYSYRFIFLRIQNILSFHCIPKNNIFILAEVYNCNNVSLNSSGCNIIYDWLGKYTEKAVTINENREYGISSGRF